jgi:hypothetical protein
MATLNIRNESNKFIKLLNDSYVHKPSGVTEDVTVQLLDVTEDKIFNVYSDESCGAFLGLFKVIFRVNDGVYLNLENIGGNKLKGDQSFGSGIEVSANSEDKLLDWASLNSSTVINVTLSNV